MSSEDSIKDDVLKQLGDQIKAVRLFSPCLFEQVFIIKMSISVYSIEIFPLITKIITHCCLLSL